MMKYFIKIALIVLGFPTVASISHAAETTADLETRSVVLADTIKTGDRIGRIRFLGMLTLPDITRGGVRLSQLSGLAWDDDDGILYAISDKGGLFHLRPEFNGNILTGLRLLQAMAL